jgi:hypothetical protein
MEWSRHSVDDGLMLMKTAFKDNNSKLYIYRYKRKRRLLGLSYAISLVPPSP